MVTGTTNAKAATPMYLTSWTRICSVAYAEDEMTSDDNTASAVGLPRRSIGLALGGERRARGRRS